MQNKKIQAPTALKERPGQQLQVPIGKEGARAGVFTATSHQRQGLQVVPLVAGPGNPTDSWTAGTASPLTTVKPGTAGPPLELRRVGSNLARVASLPAPSESVAASPGWAARSTAIAGELVETAVMGLPPAAARR